MVLVETLARIVYGKAAIEHHIHGSLVGATFKSIAVTFRHHAVYYGILVCQTVFENDCNIIIEATALLEEHVVAVVRIVVCTAAIEIVSGAYRYLRCEAVGITIALILVLIGITVQDIVEGTEVLYLHTRVAVLVELAVFDDIVVGILCAVLYVCGRAAGRFVALYKETVVACVCYIHMVEVPVRGCQSDALIRVVAMFMIWMVAIDYGSPVETYERVVVVCRAVAVVDIYSCCRSVFSRCEINRCAWFHRLVDGKLYTCKRRFCRQSVVSITTCR